MGYSILRSLCTPIIDLICKGSADLSRHYVFVLPCCVFLHYFFHQEKNFNFFGPPTVRSTDEPLSLPDVKAGQRRRSFNFEFAFNDADFSDRVLHIEIMDDSFDTVMEVKTLHINSLLLAGNSPFFHKLFKNGMRESNQRDVTLKISASEKEGVMEVLNFMYTNTLTSQKDVLGVLLAADKYEATDCVRYCGELLQKMPISLDSSLLYLELPPSVLMYEEVQPLIEAAKKCLLTHYKDIKKSQEVMALPLSAFAALLESDRVVVDLSGDDVYEIILKWARVHYPELDKRREILATNLIQFIRFRHMSSSKLKEVLVCPDLDREELLKLILEAFIMMVEVPYWQKINESNNCQVIKVEKSEPPQPHCVVYFDIKKEDCRNLFPSNRLNSQSFRLGGRSFYLSAQCCMGGKRHSFGLYLCMTKGSQSCLVDFEFDTISKSSMKFQNKRNDKVMYSATSLSWGYEDLFSISWSDFMSKDCDYFIDEILHLRADLIIKDSEA